MPRADSRKAVQRFCRLANAKAASPGKRASESRRTEAALAGRIDHHINAGLVSAKVEAAPRADDAEFVRRAYLDLVGRIPSVAEVRTFLDDKAPDKRQRLVEKLLDGPGYVNHFSNVWKALLLPEANADFTLRYYFVPSFDA